MSGRFGVHPTGLIALFKAICRHSGQYFSDFEFHNVGLSPEPVAAVFLDLNDPGAQVGLREAAASPFNRSGTYSDQRSPVHSPNLPDSMLLGAFQTPRLRCVSRRPSFMHTGQMKSLRRVVDFFNIGGGDHGYLGKNELKSLHLESTEQADLVQFLEVLTPEP